MASVIGVGALHPFGVQPSGNAFLTSTPPSRAIGLGYAQALSDELILSCLGYLDGKALSCTSRISQALYAFCNADELWRTLCLSSFGADWGEWSVDWKTTFVRRASTNKTWTYSPIRVRGLFSDLLYKPHLCAAVSPSHAPWLSFDNCPREDASAFSVHDFVERYERANRPVVMQGAAKGWLALEKWSDEYLCAAFGHHPVHCAGFDLPLDRYLTYLHGCSGAEGQSQEQTVPREEQPLYLFDKTFVSKAPSLAADFAVPPYFADDLFAVMDCDSAGHVQVGGAVEGGGAGPLVAGPATACRPDYRWLILGPARSGSVFHKDPNGTSAWNAVIRGAKKWVLWPPNCPPPGVFASADGADVASPVSVVEWFLDFYAQSARMRDKMIARAEKQEGAGVETSTDATSGCHPVASKRPHRIAHLPSASGPSRLRTVMRSGTGTSTAPSASTDANAVPFECVVRAGDAIFVPRGWWHAVLNVEDSLAVTQNYVSRSGATAALDFLMDMPYAISGLPEGQSEGFADRWLRALRVHRPDVASELDAHVQSRLAAQEKRRHAWTDMMAEHVQGTAEAGNGHSRLVSATGGAVSGGQPPAFRLSTLWTE